jgi:Putative prokaryotic signal transducing protein
MPNSIEWMIVYITHNLPDAQIVAGRLQFEGVMALVNYAPGASALGITIGSLGEVSIVVHPDDYERALQILDPDGFDELPDTTDDESYT